MGPSQTVFLSASPGTRALRLERVTQTCDGFAGRTRATNVEVASLTGPGFLAGVKASSGWLVHDVEVTKNQIGCG